MVFYLFSLLLLVKIQLISKNFTDTPQVVKEIASSIEETSVKGNWKDIFISLTFFGMYSKQYHVQII